jgi:hypothetical protein
LTGIVNLRAIGAIFLIVLGSKRSTPAGVLLKTRMDELSRTVDSPSVKHCDGVAELRSSLRLIAIENGKNQLQRLSVSTRGHPAGDLAVSPVTLSFRDVEDLLGERGIAVSYETVRRWVTTSVPRLLQIFASVRRSLTPRGIWTKST